MKTKFRNLVMAAAAVITLGAATTACNDKDNPSTPPNNTMVDIVTLESTSDNGFVVTTRKIDNSPLVTLTATNAPINTELVKVGQRFLLSYYPESGIQYKTGNITAYAYRPILNAKIIEGTAQEYNSWGTEAQDIVSMWRTGNFINVYTQAPYSQIPSQFDLVVDKTTLDNEVPQCYLLFKSDNVYESAPKDYYATFDISSVWNRENVRGLRVSVAGISTPLNQYTFHKDNSEVIRPND